MEILVSNDIEYIVQQALKDYFTIYCRPLPKNYSLPCLLVTQTGGNDEDTIDFYSIVIDSTKVDTVRLDSLPKWRSIKKDTILNLRTADTTELKLIRGIGSYRAKMIVRYREQLGGYARVEQILEARGMDKVVADSILPHFYIDSVVLNKMPVNKIRPEVLHRHPYLSFEQAKAIYEYRRRHIRIKSAEELKKIKGLSPTDIEKISIYLDFSQ